MPEEREVVEDVTMALLVVDAPERQGKLPEVPFVGDGDGPEPAQDSPQLSWPHRGANLPRELLRVGCVGIDVEGEDSAQCHTASVSHKSHGGPRQRKPGMERVLGTERMPRGSALYPMD